MRQTGFANALVQDCVFDRCMSDLFCNTRMLLAFAETTSKAGVVLPHGRSGATAKPAPKEAAACTTWSASASALPQLCAACCLVQDDAECCLHPRGHCGASAHSVRQGQRPGCHYALSSALMSAAGETVDCSVENCDTVCKCRVTPCTWPAIEYSRRGLLVIEAAKLLHCSRLCYRHQRSRKSLMIASLPVPGGWAAGGLHATKVWADMRLALTKLAAARKRKTQTASPEHR